MGWLQWRSSRRLIKDIVYLYFGYRSFRAFDVSGVSRRFNVFIFSSRLIRGQCVFMFTNAEKTFRYVIG